MVYIYGRKVPDIDEIVIAKVIKVSEYGVSVTLNEYGDIDGFINCGEVSRKKRVNMNKLLVVGKNVLLNVLRVDKDKKYIDLSKRTVCEEDIKIFQEKHKIHTRLYQMFCYIFMKSYGISDYTKIEGNNEELFEFMENTLWYLQTKYENDYIIEKISNKTDFENLINEIDFTCLDVNKQEFSQHIVNFIDSKINRNKPELTEHIKLTTLKEDGLNDIKYILDFENYDFYDKFFQDFDLNITFESSTVYLLNIKQKDFDIKGEYNINSLSNSIKNEIKNRSIEKSVQYKISI